MRVVDGMAKADSKAMPMRVVELNALSGHRLWLRYASGEERLFDATPLLTSGAFSRLTDERVFARVALDHGVPTWPDADVDLAPEYIYQESVEASSHSFIHESAQP